MTMTGQEKLKRSGRFIINGFTMTAVALLMRTVAMAFNSYVVRAAGAEAIGLYSLLSGVYGFAITLALSGINLSVTRLVSEHLALGDSKSASCVLKRAFGLAALFGFLASVTLYFVTDTVSSSWLHELRVIRPLKILCISLPAVSVSSVINGYFNAVKRVYKNAASQFTEMMIKIASTVLLFALSSKKDAEAACIILALGGVIAELAVLLLNMVIYTLDKSAYIDPSAQGLPRPGIEKSILKISMPVAFTSYFRSALISIEHSLIPKGLIKHGADKSAALASYGTLGSMALTVINFPYALIGSFASLMIPEITESRAQGKKRHIQYLSHRVYQFTSVFSFFLMGIFLDFSYDIGSFLYSSEQAGEYIKYLAFIVPIMYTDTVTDSILKGMGEQLYSMKVNIADALISVSLVWLLVPRHGIIGYIVTIYVAEIINAAFSIARTVKICGIGRSALSMYARAAFSVTGALALSRLIFNVLAVNSLIRFLIYFVFYFVLVKLTDIFSKEDFIWVRSIFRRSV